MTTQANEILERYLAVAEAARNAEFYVRSNQRKRWLTRELVERHRIGCAPTLAQCTAAGLSHAELTSVGLLNAQWGSLHYRDCMVIPFLEGGTITGFVSRRLTDNDPTTGEPLTKDKKSMYLPGPPNGVALPCGGGLDALGEQSAAPGVLLVEGMLDAIACGELGHPGVALLRKTPSDELGKRVRAWSARTRGVAYLALDGTADVTEADRLRAGGLLSPFARICRLPEGQDPDDLSAEILQDLKDLSLEVCDAWIACLRVPNSSGEMRRFFSQLFSYWCAWHRERARELRERVCKGLGLTEAEAEEFFDQAARHQPKHAAPAPGELKEELPLPTPLRPPADGKRPVLTNVVWGARWRAARKNERAAMAASSPAVRAELAELKRLSALVSQADLDELAAVEAVTRPFPEPAVLKG